MSNTLLALTFVAGVTGTHLQDGAAELVPEGPARAPYDDAQARELERELQRDFDRYEDHGDEVRMVCDTARSVADSCAYFDRIPPSIDTELDTELSWDRGGYFGFGVAPGSTLQTQWYGGGAGFNPNLRYDAEFGWAWRREDERRGLRVGVHPYLTQYFGRWRPAGGADVVVRGSAGHFYARGGLGAMGGLPRSRSADDFLPAVGGVVGLGIQGRREDVYGRIGVDYDVRVNTNFEVVQTVFLVARLEFAWF